MAGNFADVPDLLINYDRDGSAVGNFYFGSSSYTELTLSEKQALLNESSDSVVLALQFCYQERHITFFFPGLMDLTGAMIAWTAAQNAAYMGCDYSTNATNELDGTWTAKTFTPTTAGVNPTYRTSILALVQTGVKAIRFKWNSGSGSSSTATVRAIHLYGRPSSGALPDRLRLWHPTLDQELGATAFDFSDVARSATSDKTFRVKNNSATLTANSVALSVSALTDTSPTVVGQMTLDNNGSGFASTQTITSIAPGAISALQTLRFTVSATATMGIFRQRLRALAGSWT